MADFRDFLKATLVLCAIPLAFLAGYSLHLLLLKYPPDETFHTDIVLEPGDAPEGRDCRE